MITINLAPPNTLPGFASCRSGVIKPSPAIDPCDDAAGAWTSPYFPFSIANFGMGLTNSKLNVSSALLSSFSCFNVPAHGFLHALAHTVDGSVA